MKYLGPEFTLPYMQHLEQFLAHEEKAGKIIYPAPQNIFNAFNSNAAVGATSNAGEPPAAINTTYGSAWLKPLNILQARYVKFGAQITF